MIKMKKCWDCGKTFDIDKKENQYNMKTEPKLYCCGECGQFNSDAHDKSKINKEG